MVSKLPTAATGPIYFICEMGVRSAHACAMMMAAGMPHVVNVEGGTQAWASAGLPLEHGR
jgi:rhodanese-related sulfurtransferase